MTNSFYFSILALVFCGLLALGHAAPVADSHRNPSVPSPRDTFNGGLVDSRYFMKMKKWFDSQASGASTFGDDSWNRMHYFPNEKRMDEKFIADDYPNLNSGRLEWNFNRL